MHLPAPQTLPQIIQGGMGVAVSNWHLANAVSRSGQLGVVSGTGLDSVLVRRLQDGDPGGHMRRAMERFPIPGVAEEVLRRYFNPNGRANGAAYKLLPMYKQVVSAARQRVTILANFVEVSLAREGHEGPVGINLLTKVQMPNMASLYGAMLAGVNVVLMGAGIPREIPGVLDALAEHREATMRFDVEGQGRDEIELLRFDPANIGRRRRRHSSVLGSSRLSRRPRWPRRSRASRTAVSTASWWKAPLLVVTTRHRAASFG